MHPAAQALQNENLPNEKDSRWALEYCERILKGLDRVRAWLLRQSLQLSILRQIYRSTWLRLGTSFLLMTSIYLFFALRRPDILLVWGPLVFGYLHLVASYRFMNAKSLHSPSTNSRLSEFQTLSFITIAAMLLHAFLKNQKLIPEMPYEG